MKRRHLAWAGLGLGAAALGGWWRWRSEGAGVLAGHAAGVPASASSAGGAAHAASGSTPSQGLADFWSRQAEAPDGSPLPLGRFRGRPLLVNFWATWCPPCIKEMPLIDAFARANAPRGWQVLGIAIDRREAVVEYLRRQPVSYAIALAGFEGTEWSRLLGNDKGALPFSVAFDAEGRIVQRKLGEISETELAAWAGR